MAQRFLATAAVLVLLALGAGRATAEVVLWGDDTDKPKNPTNFTGTEFPILVDAAPFFVLRTGAAGYTLAQRGGIVDLRIDEALSRHLSGPVSVSPIRGKPTIYVGPVRIVTVYPEDAVAAKAKDANELAAAWAEALAVGLPKVVPGGKGGKGGGVAGLYNISINNHQLFVLHWSANYPTVTKRGAAVDAAVTETLSRRAKTVCVAPSAHGCGVWADGVLVVEATAEDAKAENQTQESLAEQWAANLRGALSLIAPASAPKKGAQTNTGL